MRKFLDPQAVRPVIAILKLTSYTIPNNHSSVLGLKAYSYFVI